MENLSAPQKFVSMPGAITSVDYVIAKNNYRPRKYQPEQRPIQLYFQNKDFGILPGKAELVNQMTVNS